MTATLGKIDDVWERPPVGSSNALKAAIYAERAKLTLQRIVEDEGIHMAVRKGTVSRRQLAILVGCGYATLNQNSAIRALLDDADKKLARRIGSSPVELEDELRNEFVPDLPINVLPKNSSVALLVRTNEEFCHAGLSYPGVPSIVFADGIHEASGDWFRHLVLFDDVRTSTVHQYAKVLRPYLRFCRRRRRLWELADDDWLLEWRSHILISKGVKKRQANYSLQVIFQFYRFCEERGILRYRVGCYERSTLPEEFLHVKFPITAKRVSTSRRKIGVSWVTPLLLRNVDSSIGNRATPTNQELEAVHRAALKRRNGIRNTLLMSWAEDTGGRRIEILQVKVRQIPDLNTIEELACQPDAWWPFEVLRKGGRHEVLRAQPDTLYATHAYLRLRSVLVQYFKQKNSAYVEPEELFISSTTGAALKADSVTALIRPFFRQAGLETANIHRIRAKFAVDTVETLLDAFLEHGIQFAHDSNWMETILQQAAIRLGHKDPSSLRHYLTVALERRIRLTHAAKERLAIRTERDAKLALEAAIDRLKPARRLLAELDAISVHHEGAAALLKYAIALQNSAV